MPGLRRDVYVSGPDLQEGPVTGHRHATDRYDVTAVMQCPNECFGIELEATNSEEDADGLLNRFEECPNCGGYVDYLADERPTEVLD